MAKLKAVPGETLEGYLKRAVRQRENTRGYRDGVSVIMNWGRLSERARHMLTFGIEISAVAWQEVEYLEGLLWLGQCMRFKVKWPDMEATYDHLFAIMATRFPENPEFVKACNFGKLPTPVVPGTSRKKTSGEAPRERTTSKDAIATNIATRAKMDKLEKESQDALQAHNAVERARENVKPRTAVLAL